MTDIQHYIAPCKIMRAVISPFGMSGETIRSKKKNHNFVQARQIACYLMRRNSRMPLKQIGKYMKRDHSTVMNSLERFEYDYSIDYKGIRNLAHYVLKNLENNNN